MTSDDDAMLRTIDARGAEMKRLLCEWVSINTGTDNVQGISRFGELLDAHFAALADRSRLIEAPPRPIVTERGEVAHRAVAPMRMCLKKENKPRRILLVGHMDTVFPADSPFQQVCEVDENTWVGPGAADMKGGLLVMLEALRAFSTHPAADNVGWTVFLNSDEEVGSPVSTLLLHELAKQHEVGLVYEPALADGRLAGARGGSANFDLIIRGRSAHVGREFDQGRSAIHIAAEATGLLASLNAADGVTVNVGKIDGGGPVNQVADVAVVRMNIRVADVEKQQAIENDLRRLTAVLNRRDGISAALHGQFFSPPKPLEGKTLSLFEAVRDVGSELDLDIHWQPTGGVCDGNKLQAAGLPTIDTLGVRGGGLHSQEEFILLDSLVERAKLSALLLVRLAQA